MPHIPTTVSVPPIAPQRPAEADAQVNTVPPIAPQRQQVTTATHAAQQEPQFRDGPPAAAIVAAQAASGHGLVGGTSTEAHPMLAGVVHSGDAGRHAGKINTE